MKGINQDSKQTAVIFSDLSKMIKDGQIKDNLEDYVIRPHIVAHDAGMLIFQKFNNLFDAFSFCNGIFAYGCEHGVITEYLDRKSFDTPITAKKVAAVCDELVENGKFSSPSFGYSQCIHVIAHSLVAKLKGNLKEALHECESLPSSILCKRGVLQEYSRGESHLGRHSHQDIGTINLPCHDLEAAHKTECYFYLGRRSREFSKEKTLSQSHEICLQIPAEFKLDCIRGLATDIVVSTFENVDRSVETCNDLEGIQDDCLKALRLVNIGEFEYNQNFHRALEVRSDSQTSP